MSDPGAICAADAGVIGFGGAVLASFAGRRVRVWRALRWARVYVKMDGRRPFGAHGTCWGTGLWLMPVQSVSEKVILCDHRGDV